jgi:hypothetical protein
MAIIKSGASSSLLTVDTTPLAARVIPYTPDGVAIPCSINATRGLVDVRVQQSATTGAGAVVWALRNSGASDICITSIVCQLYQAGTGAATEMQYEWTKYTGVTGFAGSPTSVTPVTKKTSVGVGGVTVAVLDTGMTLSSGSLVAAFWNMYWARITHSATATAESCSPQYVLDLSEYPLILAANETLALRQAKTSVIGDGVTGCVQWVG